MAETDDESKHQRRKTVDKLARRQELEDVAFVLSTVEGRRLYWRLMAQFGVLQQPFTGNNTTFFNCGELNAGLYMWREMEEADPSAYIKHLEEARIEKAKRS